MASQNPTQNALVVADIAVRQDSEGRFCINDLHKVAGGEKRHAPNEWLRNKQALELIEELTKPGIPGLKENQPLKVAHGGSKPGTYVCKELVYAYAMWISPAFHLKVVRAYDAMMTQQQPTTFDPMQVLNDPAAMRGLLLTYTEKVLSLQEIIREQQPKVEFHDAVADAVNCQSIQEVAKALETGQNRLFQFLRDERILMNNNLPYQQYLDAGYFRVAERRYKSESGDNHIYTKTLVTGKGLQFIQRRLQNWQLELGLD